MIIEFEAVGSRAMRWSAEGDHTITLTEGVAAIADAEGKPVAKLSLLADDGTFYEPVEREDVEEAVDEDTEDTEAGKPATAKQAAAKTSAKKSAKPAKRGSA